MNKTCSLCTSIFTITEQELNLLDKISPVFAGKKYAVPPPTICPQCRQQRRLAANNEMKLYQRQCDHSGQTVLSVFSPKSEYKVYHLPVWWDKSKWNPLDYGRDFDFSRPFFEQFEELSKAVPHETLTAAYTTNENSDYINYAAFNKDCYLIMHADNNRECMYGYGVKHDDRCVDILNAFNSQLLYECIDCKECYNIAYSQDCSNCTDSYFLQDCQNCKNCFGCINLRNKEYCIFNEQKTKEEYESFLREHSMSSFQEIEAFKKKVTAFQQSQPHQYLHMKQVENSYGDHINNCKNVQNSFNVSEAEDCKYIYQCYYDTKDSMDLYQFGNNTELTYDSAIVGHDCFHILFCNICCVNIKEAYYSFECTSSEYIFGGVCLDKTKYIILNKQYTEQEWNTLVPKIIEHMMETGEWGEFFPASTSPFGYNETRAMDYFPLSKEEALSQGFRWRDEPEKQAIQQSYIFPDHINDVDELVLKEVLTCSSCQKNYRITSKELAIYKKRGIPLPRNCFFCRHQHRMAKKNPQKIWESSCSKCNTSIKTTSRRNKSEILYCEPCYQKEVY